MRSVNSGKELGLPGVHPHQRAVLRHAPLQRRLLPRAREGEGLGRGPDPGP